MSIVMISWLNKKSDLIGMVSSALCLAHCLALPFLLSFRAFSDSQNELVEIAFLAICLGAVWWSAKGATAPIRIAFWLFVGGLCTGILAEDYLFWAPYLLYVSSAGLVLTHGLNLWQKRKIKAR
jgi:hypothetical protein